jgi:hypothetical protein
MIAFVDQAPQIELQGEHFRLTVTSGDDTAEYLLTAKSFFGLKAYCAEAFAKRQIADMEAREKVIQFSHKAKRGKR